METAARLIDVSVPAEPARVVLVLHGGGSRQGTMMVIGSTAHPVRTPVRPTQLSVLRMVPIARTLARAGRGRLAVYRLLNSARGWDTTRTPVQDAHWALDEIAGRLGSALPACLVGHSLGGRAALLAAARPEVRGAVGLAPWVYPTDVARGIRDTRILIIHGDRDRVASPQRSAALARNLATRVPVDFRVVPGGRHVVLRHGRQFIAPARRFVLETLLAAEPGTVSLAEPWAAHG